MGRRLAGLAVAATILAGCSSSHPKTAATTTAGTKAVTVRVMADLAGLGSCMQSPVNKSVALVVKDQHDTTIGTAPFTLTPGADACDFTSTVTVPSSATFYTFETDSGVKLGTRPGTEVRQALEIDFHVDVEGNVSAD